MLLWHKWRLGHQEYCSLFDHLVEKEVACIIFAWCYYDFFNFISIYFLVI